MFIDPNKPYYAKGERTSVCSNYNKPEVTTDDNDIAVHEVEQTSVCSNHNKLISPFMR
jgi:hypothetical protein